MIPTLAFPGDRMPGQLGPINRARPFFLISVEHTQLVVGRDALGDRDDQLDAGVLGLQDRVGGKPRWHEDHRRVGTLLLDRLVEGVEDGHAVDVLATLTGGDPGDDLVP